MQKPNKVAEELGIFAKCQNKWCLQKGLQKLQYTKCESVENKGKTCINPEIRYGATIVGLPIHESETIHYGKWCGQLGGWYVDHTIGRRTGYILEGCTGYDNPDDPWHWCDYNFFNQPLTNHTTSNDFITSITCNRITNNCEEPNNVMEEANNGVEEPNKVEEESNNVKAEPINIVNQGVLSAYFELILKAQIKLFSRPLKPNKEVEEPNNAVKEQNNVVEKPNSIVDEPNNEMEDPNNVVQEPHSVHCVLEKPNYELEEPGIFAKCQNEWCLQKGLQKPQHTKCESVTNNGKTCNNPEIKYGIVTGGLPWEYPSNNYEKWCAQLGGEYAGHTFGTRTGHPVIGCTGADDPGNWHWCVYWNGGKWYNKSLTIRGRNSFFITSISCTNMVEERNYVVKEPSNVVEETNNIAEKPSYTVEEPDNLVEEPNNVVEEPGIFAKCQNEWCLQKGLQKPQHTKCELVTNNGKTCNNPEIKYGTTKGGFPYKNSRGNYEKWCDQLGGVYASHMFDPRSKFQIIQNPKSSVNHITIGTRTGYAVSGCTGFDDPGNWHWCDLSDGYWYNQSLDYHETSNNFITSITCMN